MSNLASVDEVGHNLYCCSHRRVSYIVHPQYLTPSAFQECYLVGYILRIPKATASDRGLFCLMLMPTLAWIYVSKKTELGELRVGVITKHTVKKRFV